MVEADPVVVNRFSARRALWFGFSGFIVDKTMVFGCNISTQHRNIALLPLLLMLLLLLLLLIEG